VELGVAGSTHVSHPKKFSLEQVYQTVQTKMGFKCLNKFYSSIEVIRRNKQRFFFFNFMYHILSKRSY